MDRRTSVGAALVALLTAAAPDRAALGQIVVDTADDVADTPFDASGPCGTGALSDLPGADGRVSLREAIIAANNTAGPQSITFDTALRGATLEIEFDGDDDDAAPDPLPTLCGGETSLDGDTDGDGAPDVALHGSPLFPPLTTGLVLFSSDNRINGLRLTGYDIGISVLHISAFTAAPESARNELTNNAIEGGVSCLVVGAGAFDNPVLGGSVRDTRIAGNTITGCTAYGIFAFTGDAAESLLAQMVVEGNRVDGSGQFGIALQANVSAAGSGAIVSRNVIRDNDVTATAGTGISVFGYAGRDNRIADLSIAGNRLVDNGFGISVTSGACGATGNDMTGVVLRDNHVQGGGLSAVGGSNFGCPGTPPPAQANAQHVEIRGNRIDVPLATGLNVLGGYDQGHANSVEARVEGNRVTALGGIAIVGGQAGTGSGRGAADNHVGVVLRGNATGNGGVGISISAGGSGAAERNTISVVAERNTACNGLVSDVQCYGGLPALPGYPANLGSGNQARGAIRFNQASRIATGAGTPGNACLAEVEANNSCRAGDVNCDVAINAADLIAHAELAATEEDSICGLDAEEPVIVAAMFTGS